MKLDVINQSYVNLLKDIKTYFHNSSDSIHKARNEIKTINYNNENLVVTSFKVPNIINKIIYTFFKIKRGNL